MLERTVLDANAFLATHVAYTHLSYGEGITVTVPNARVHVLFPVILAH